MKEMPREITAMRNPQRPYPAADLAHPVMMMPKPDPKLPMTPPMAELMLFTMFWMKLLNDTVIDFSTVIGEWSGSVAGTGIWSILFATVLLGIAFVGVWFILAIGDAVRDVTEVG